jgi:hypothetical protein
MNAIAALAEHVCAPTMSTGALGHDVGHEMHRQKVAYVWY